MDEIIIYSTKGCPYCRMAKDYFEKKGIPAREIDIGIDSKAAEEMVKRSGEVSVPQIVIGGKVIVGFNRQLIERTLKSTMNRE